MLLSLHLQKSSSFREKLLRLFPAGRKFVDGNKALHSQVKNNLGGTEADSFLMKLFGSNKDKIGGIAGLSKLDTKVPTLTELPLNYFDDILDSTDTSPLLKDLLIYAKSNGYKNISPIIFPFPTVKTLSQEELTDIFKEFSKKDPNFRIYNPSPGDAFNYDEMYLDGLAGKDSSISKTIRPGLIYHDQIWSKPKVELGPTNRAATKEWKTKTHKLKPEQSYIGSPEYRKAMEGAVDTAKNTDKARKLLFFRDLPVTATALGGTYYGADQYRNKINLAKQKEKETKKIETPTTTPTALDLNLSEIFKNLGK